MKIMKNLKYTLVIPALLILMAGCVNEDDLVQVDPNLDTNASFWKTDNDALAGVNAVYGSLMTDGTYMRSTPLMLYMAGHLKLIIRVFTGPINYSNTFQQLKCRIQS
jgi:hypothetical protein